MKTTKRISVMMIVMAMVFGLFSAIPLTASAATFSVSGAAKDKDGNLLKGVEVVLKIGGSTDSSFNNYFTGNYIASTGSDGKFTFPAVDGGVYNVYVYNAVLDYFYSAYIGKITVNGNVTDYTITVSEMGGTWVKNQNGTWSFKLTNGNRATGWRQDGGKWYYMDANGIMQTGWLCFDGTMFGMPTTWYYLNEGGDMVTGWLKWEDNWYYLNPSGEMITNASKKIDGKIYKFDASGVCTNP